MNEAAPESGAGIVATTQRLVLRRWSQPSDEIGYELRLAALLTARSYASLSNGRSC